MVLGDVEETVTTVEVDEDTYEEIVRVSLVYAWPVLLAVIFSELPASRKVYERWMGDGADGTALSPPLVEDASPHCIPGN